MAIKSCCGCFNLRTGSTIIVRLILLDGLISLLTGDLDSTIMVAVAACAQYAILKSDPLLLVPILIYLVLCIAFQAIFVIVLSAVYLHIISDPMNSAQSILNSYREILLAFTKYSVNINTNVGVIIFSVGGIISLVLTVYSFVVLIAMFKHLRKEISLKNNKNVIVPTGPNAVMASGVQLEQMERGQISIYPKLEI